jgi:very-long-chain (3R)-3-hydroxyacyl-CoA dehydratase
LPELQASSAVTLLLLSWAGSDVVRYAWAATSSLQLEARALSYARYTLFLVAYPLGATAEWLLLLAARPSFADGQVALRMPNALNCACDYHSFLGALIAAYPLLFAHMFAHMLRQRRKKFGASGGKSKGE